MRISEKPSKAKPPKQKLDPPLEPQVVVVHVDQAQDQAPPNQQEPPDTNPPPHIPNPPLLPTHIPDPEQPANQPPNPPPNQLPNPPPQAPIQPPNPPEIHLI